MRKIYSLVLMTAMLFVGTNVWADDISVVNHTKGTSLSTNDLQAAVDFVGAGDTATITLNNTITISKAVVIPHVTGTINEMTNPTVYDRTGQRICLDMRGFNIQGDDEATDGYGCIQILKGTLHIKSSAGPSEIKRPKKNGGNNPKKSAVTVFGAPWDKKDVVWTILEIDENITLNSNTVVDGVANQGNTNNKVYGLCIQDLGTLPEGYSDTTKIGYTTNFNGKSAEFLDAMGIQSRILNSKGTYDAACAYGIKVFVRGTIFGHYRGINVVGNINATPQMDISDTIKHRHFANYPYYEHKYPYVKIYPTAQVFCVNDGIIADGNGGIYAGGYCVWDISGNVHGQTGIYAKAGDFVLTDATVASDSPNSGKSGDYHKGVTSGSGIFVASDAGYAGGTGITLEGDTKVSGNGSSAITDVLATNSTETGSNTSHLTINGGTIIPGNDGEAIEMTTGTANVTTVYGGSISGTVTKDDGEGGTTTVTVATLTPTDGSVHVTEVEVDGKTTIVVSDGPAPSAQTTVHDQTGSVTWKSALVSDDAMVDAITGNTVKTLTELVINDTMTWNGTATRAKSQTLTIENGSTLSVGKVIMGSGAQIIVEAGAKLIVTGDKGIVAPKTSNIVLKASETSQATFLFAPGVTSNRHPNATVQFVSRAYRDNVKLAQYQRFVLPVRSIKVEDIENNWSEAVYGKSGSQPSFITAIYEWNVNAWNRIDNIADYEMNAFKGYNMTNNSATAGVTYTFKGETVGNENNDLKFAATGWYFFGNSYTASANTKDVLQGIVDDKISKTIYLWESANQVYRDYSLDDIDNPLMWNAPEGIPAMQTFIFNQIENGNVTNTINYETSIWNYNVSPAPARIAERSDITTLRIVVSDINGNYDRVSVRVADRYTSEFDNGGDATKYINEGHMNMYATTELGSLAGVATNDALGTMFTLQTTDETDYMITFTSVSDDIYALRDNITGSIVAISNGNTYCFSAEANQTIEGRFEIVGRQEMPTAVETIEEMNHEGTGIYSLTGQYLGSAEKWFTLPAGIYVINGQKVVK